MDGEIIEALAAEIVRLMKIIKAKEIEIYELRKDLDSGY